MVGAVCDYAHCRLFFVESSRLFFAHVTSLPTSPLRFLGMVWLPSLFESWQSFMYQSSVTSWAHSDKALFYTRKALELFKSNYLPAFLMGTG
jgi:hypothetical protein